jgi:hypothetical protein
MLAALIVPISFHHGNAGWSECTYEFSTTLWNCYRATALGAK